MINKNYPEHIVKAEIDSINTIKAKMAVNKITYTDLAKELGMSRQSLFRKFNFLNEFTSLEKRIINEFVKK